METQPTTLNFTGGPLSTFNVIDNIQVHASNASANLTSATNSFVVPEPMTSMLLGSGLLAFGLMLRRKRN
jgi:PEP-CTERM motif